jgi:alkanesulfonate monooxygenase SsuD/methylene tetrahydromethanopterin reductase-like flavin-dependent oxidoreductase (luciferase family)
MRFGYFSNQNNRHLEKPFRQVVEETRDLARYCDRTGWHSIWFTEHHFGHEGFEVCPNPVLMSCDISAHTHTIRVGQAANIITFWHPLRVAEDLAMLDHMNNGRTEVALGRGLYGREALQLNKLADTRNPAQNYKIFAETLEIMRRAWREEFFEFSGEFYTYPDPGFVWDHAMSPPAPGHMDMATKELKKVALVPRTLQQPSPPLWQVVDGPGSIQFAAQNDLQAMMWIPPTDSLVWRFELYQEEASKAQGRDVEYGHGVALVRDMFVTETMEEAERLGGEGILDYLRWVCHWRGLGNHTVPGETLPETPGKLDLLTYDWLHPRNLLFGTPDYVAEKIEEMQDKLNLQTLLVWSHFPGVDHEAAMRSVRLFTEEVMPRFADQEAPARAAAS